MDILFISKYILVIAIIIMMLATLRASAYKSTSMGLLGSSVIVNAFALVLLVGGELYNLQFYRDISLALILLVGGELYNLQFYRDISLALIFFGFVGTIAFAVTVGGEDK